ncbi:MAG: zinc ribbon domain-containing protein [Ruminococcus sp.]
MDTKFCPKCGKELPVEAVFCPYCMTKLIDAKTGEPIKIKKHKYIIPIFIVTVIIILAVTGIVVFFAFQANFDKASERSSAQAEAANANSAEYDYSSYIGIWCDKSTDIATLTENGGNMLEIISVKGDIVRFTYTKASSTFGRIARISNVASQIIDGIGTFTFDDDNWLNSGTGKIKLLDNEIYIETNITKRNDSANWDIGGTFYLIKSDNSIIDFKNYNYLGADFDEVKNHFGEEIQTMPEALDNTDLHQYSGLGIMVNNITNEIVSITVEYSSNQLSKSSLCYGSINGNSTYDDVYSQMGEPAHNNISDGRIAYIVNGNYLYFQFDDNMNLTSFALELENNN